MGLVPLSSLRWEREEGMGRDPAGPCSVPRGLRDHSPKVKRLLVDGAGTYAGPKAPQTL